MELLTNRASNGKLGEPAPDDDTLQLAFEAALRAPDHAVLRPWRIQLIRGPARARLGEIMREALRTRAPESTPEELDRAAQKPLRAPLILVVSARVVSHPKVPAIEQILSAGAAAHSVLLALQARGYGAIWRTGAPAYDPQVKRALGLDEDDALVGFLYCGTPTRPAPPLRRPTPADHVEEWT